MNYTVLSDKLIKQNGAEKSTMMGSPCLRFKGEFFTMMFDKENSLIVKLPESRVTELIENGTGNEFNFTKKRFKEWLLIPMEHEAYFGELMQEAWEYAKSKT